MIEGNVPRIASWFTHASCGFAASSSLIDVLVESREDLEGREERVGFKKGIVHSVSPFRFIRW